MSGIKQNIFYRLVIFLYKYFVTTYNLINDFFVIVVKKIVFFEHHLTNLIQSAIVTIKVVTNKIKKEGSLCK